MRDTILSALREALEFAFPTTCCGCGRPGADVCPRCQAALVPRVHSRVLPGGRTVWSGLEFRDESASAIRALKEQGRTGLARLLAPALTAALSAALAGAPCTPEPLLVPVPTSRAAMRSRGYRVVELLLSRAGHGCSRRLSYSRRVEDQRSLGRAGRLRNTHAAMRAVRVAGADVVVVDDVVTTGATLAEAIRAIEDAGGRVIAAVALASTPPRHARSKLTRDRTPPGG